MVSVVTGQMHLRLEALLSLLTGYLAIRPEKWWRMAARSAAVM